MALKERDTADGNTVKGTPSRMFHANWKAGDWKRSLDFYTKICGFEEVYESFNSNGSKRGGFISNGHMHHDKAISEGKPAGGFTEFAFDVDNQADLAEIYHRLVEADVNVGTPMRSWQGPHASNPLTHVTTHLYFRDPEGNGVECSTDLTPNWRDHKRLGATYIDERWDPGKNPPSTQSFVNYHPEIRRVEGAPLHPKRLAHGTHVVKDLNKMRDFYSRVIGLEEMVEGPGGSFVILKGWRNYSDYSLALFPATPTRPAGAHHQSFELVEDGDFDGSEERLRQAGVQVEMVIRHPSKKVLYVKDPDGVLSQFYWQDAGFVDSLAGMDPGMALYLS